MITAPDYGLIISSQADGTRPAAAWGATVTPAENAFGSWADVLAAASFTDDAYGIQVIVNSNDVAGAARDTLVTIGLDEVDFIQHLLCSSAGPYFANTNAGVGGVQFHFPVRIKAGQKISAKASINNATVGTLRIAVRLWCRPSDSDAADALTGTFVQTFGANTAASAGTALTAGTSSEGTAVELGTLDRPIFGWEYGCGFNNGTFVNNAHHTDLLVGDATNKRNVLTNGLLVTGTNEQVTKPAAFSWGRAVVGEKVYARTQGGPNTGTTSQTVIAYGIG